MHTSCCATIAASISTRTSRGRVTTTLNKHEGLLRIDEEHAHHRSVGNPAYAPTREDPRTTRRSPAQQVPDTTSRSSRPAALVGDPVPHPSRHLRRGRASSPPIPFNRDYMRPGGRSRADDLFHEPEHSPETDTHEDPSQATAATTHTLSGRHAKRYNPQYPLILLRVFFGGGPGRPPALTINTLRRVAPCTVANEARSS
jgi:hypothetical protein